MSRHPRTMPGAERFGPGLYVVGDEMHVVMEEALAENGWADNAHNRRLLERVLKDWADAKGIALAYPDPDDEAR